MTIKEWDEALKSVPAYQLDRYAQAISTLLRWDVFNREYGWTGLSTLKTIIELELEKR